MGGDCEEGSWYSGKQSGGLSYQLSLQLAIWHYVCHQGIVCSNGEYNEK